MVEEFPFRLILASSSVGRRALMEQAGYPFEVKPANVDEPTEAVNGNIREYVQHVAWMKAAKVASEVHDISLIISADTVGWIDGHVIGKPEDADDARRILKTLSGRVHELWTGVCTWRRPGDWQFAWQERSLVRMRSLSDQEIDEYLLTRQWEGCSGAYAIRESDDPYLTIEEGSMSNVIGLPMESLAEVLHWWVR